MTDAPSTNLPPARPGARANRATRTPMRPRTAATLPGTTKALRTWARLSPRPALHPFSGLKDSPISATIDSEEQAVSDNGPAVQSAPRITLWTENPVLTAEEARAVAALLCRAALRLETLTAGGAS